MTSAVKSLPAYRQAGYLPFCPAWAGKKIIKGEGIRPLRKETVSGKAGEGLKTEQIVKGSGNMAWHIFP